VCALEGTRPIIIEVQALVCRTGFGIPRRQATGADLNRVNLLMAVLEKRVGLKLSDCDAYVNVAGGMKLQEPAVDLGIVLAIVSGYKNVNIPQDLIAFGEVGLSGEVRSVSMAEARIREAGKLGFTTCILPQSCLKTVKDAGDMKLIGVESVGQALSYLKIGKN
jgi:DNA repair protein RadA/Sms